MTPHLYANFHRLFSYADKHGTSEAVPVEVRTIDEHPFLTLAWPDGSERDGRRIRVITINLQRPRQ